jgi:hypothetical protein
MALGDLDTPINTHPIYSSLLELFSFFSLFGGYGERFRNMPKVTIATCCLSAVRIAAIRLPGTQRQQ